MLAVIGFAFRHWRLALALVAVLAAVLTGWRLHAAGVDAERARQARAALEAWHERARFDETISAEDDVALCRRLGGGADCERLRLDQRSQLRRPEAGGAETRKRGVADQP